MDQFQIFLVGYNNAHDYIHILAKCSTSLKIFSCIITKFQNLLYFHYKNQSTDFLKKSTGQFQIFLVDENGVRDYIHILAKAQQV